MKFVLKINGTESPKAAYVGWTPVKCALTIDDYSGDLAMPVTITTGHDNKEGRIELYSDDSTAALPIDKIEHDFQTKNELTFYIAGKYPHASVSKKDTFIQVKHKNSKVSTLKKDVMVRVRKNANDLQPLEIEKFLKSFLELSKLPPKNTYSDDEYSAKPSKLLDEIVLMHTLDAANEIHGRTSFHPWHRAFLLHLERELQQIYPEVTIPYWKFDDGANKVFTSSFIGKTKQTDYTGDGLNYGEKFSPEFDQLNPLYTYAKNVLWGGKLRRAYRTLNPAVGKPDLIFKEKRIICEGESPNRFSYWSKFEERNSHNLAHFAFTGHVVDIGKDPVDLLFFMMHSNVDRLWALWQQEYERYDDNDEKTYPFQGKYDGERGEEWAEFRKLNEDGIYDVGNCDFGNFAEDTMWPWDLDHELSRPIRKWKSEREGYGEGKVPQINIKFPDSITSNYPEGPLTVKSTIDYQGRINNPVILGFDYDNIPYFAHDKQQYCETPMTSLENYIETFFNKSFSVEERLEAAEHLFLKKEEELALAMNILVDKEEEDSIRLKSIGLVDKTKGAFLDTALDIISDESESNDLRAELIHFVFASKRSNRHFPSRKPRFFDLLRGLLRNDDQKLRFQAIDILAAHEDEIVQEFLIEEVRKDESEFISKPDSIFFLSQNTKPQHAKLFRELFEMSEDLEVKKAAIEGLGNDPESADLLKKVVLDKGESYKVREAGALSLHHLDYETMNELAAQIISEPESESPNMLFASATPDPDEVDFKAGLLNMLTFTGDMDRLKPNEDLKVSLNQLMNQSPDERANFLGSFETSTNTPSESPTIIEQMAAKLLNRLDEIDEDE